MLRAPPVFSTGIKDHGLSLFTRVKVKLDILKNLGYEFRVSITPGVRDARAATGSFPFGSSTL